MARRPPSAGRSCIAARSRTRARMTLALNLAMGRRAAGGSGLRCGERRKRGALLMHRQLHRPSPAILPSSTAQLIHFAITLFSFNFSTPMGGYPGVCTYFAIYVQREALFNSSKFSVFFIGVFFR